MTLYKRSADVIFPGEMAKWEIHPVQLPLLDLFNSEGQSQAYLLPTPCYPENQCLWKYLPLDFKASSSGLGELNRSLLHVKFHRPKELQLEFSVMPLKARRQG